MCSYYDASLDAEEPKCGDIVVFDGEYYYVSEIHQATYTLVHRGTGIVVEHVEPDEIEVHPVPINIIAEEETEEYGFTPMTSGLYQRYMFYYDKQEADLYPKIISFLWDRLDVCCWLAKDVYPSDENTNWCINRDIDATCTAIMMMSFNA